MSKGFLRALCYASLTTLLLAIVLPVQVRRQVAWQIMAGWWLYLRDVVSQASINWGGLATAALSAAVVLIGTHALASWLVRSRPIETPEASDPPRPWRWRWSITGLILVILLFAAGVAAVAVIHQITWLASEIASGRYE